MDKEALDKKLRYELQAFFMFEIEDNDSSPLDIIKEGLSGIPSGLHRNTKAQCMDRLLRHADAIEIGKE